MENLKKLGSVLLAVMLCAVLSVTAVFAATTDVSETLAAGTLGVASPATAAFAGKTVSSVEQTDTAVIGNATHTDTTGIRVLDDRGSGAGWSCTMTVTHLNTLATVKKLAGANADVSFSGTYDGLLGVSDPAATFVVEVTTAGVVGDATTPMVFSWHTVTGGTAGTATSVTTTTATAYTLSNGISVTFDGATSYALADKWSTAVDVFPYTVLTATPSVIHNASGSLTGVTAGVAEAMAGTTATSGAKTIMTADVDCGLGDYYIDVDLSQTIHVNPLAGTYTSVATITVS